MELINAIMLIHFRMEKKYCVLKKYLEEFNGVKINLKQICMYKLPKDSTVQEFAFKTENKIILRSNNLKTFYDFFLLTN